MLMMDACEVGYQVGAGRRGSGGCRAVAMGKALTVRPPAYSRSCPGYSGWLQAKVSVAWVRDRSQSSDHTLLTHQLKQAKEEFPPTSEI